MEDIREDVASSPNSLINFRHALLVGAPSAIALFFLYVFSVELLLRGNIAARLLQTEAIYARHFEAFSADLEFLNNSPSAGALRALMPKAGNDAGPTLNSKLFWPANDRAIDASSEQAAFGRKSPLVPPESREFLLRYQDDWIKGRSFLESGRLKGETAFFSEIGEFQIWDIESNSPLETLAKKRKFVPHNFMPSPDTLDLISAAKIRLLRGTLDGRPLEALIETRKFASLLLTTEYMPLLLTGLAMLDLERVAYREYVDRGWLTESQAASAKWQPLPTSLIRRARRAWLASSSYLSILNLEERVQKSFSGEKLPSGLCAAINYRLPNELSMRDQLTGRWPFERTYRNNYDGLDKIIQIALKDCRLKVFSALYEPSFLGGSAYEAVDPSATWPLPVLPYFRTVFALRDMIAWPLYFDEYARP